MREQAAQLLAQGRAADAVACAQAALRDAPGDARLNLLAGQALLAQGDAEAALDFFHLALHYAPDLADALSGRVRSLERLGRTAQVEAAYREFLRANPGHADASFGLALALRNRGGWDEARSLLEAVVAADPSAAESLGLLGLIRAREYGELDHGEDLIRRALAIRPGSMSAQCNLGWVLVLQRRYEEGFQTLDRVLEADPENHEARLMRAYAHLRRGDFARGWDDTEARHQSRLAVRRTLERPRWRGEPLGDGTLLVLAEQGLGDQIMFASCVPDAIARAGPGSRLLLECDARLVGLFRRSFPQASVMAQPAAGAPPAGLEAGGRIDAQIHTGSLPALFRSSWSDFPLHRGYLRADPARVRAWRARLDALSAAPKIGISWRGGSVHTRSRLRSIEASCWSPLLARTAAFVSLQYDASPDEIGRFGAIAGIRVHEPAPAHDDYADTAALVEALDLVITVCTSVVHLCGALGRPAWVLAPSVPEWRYLDSGPSMPWYPAVRLIRQPYGESWKSVMKQATTMLDEWLVQRR